MNPLDSTTAPLTGTRLIEASAGTGKTFAITTLYVRLVIERGLSVETILVVTYTRAATAELRDRIRSRLRVALRAVTHGADPKDPELDAIARARVEAGTELRDAARLRAALRAFDQAAIYTIHGFCQRTLQDSAFESGASFDVEFMTDQGPLITEIALDFWAREIYGAPEAFVRYLRRPKPRGTPEALVELTRKAVANREMPILPGRPTVNPGAETRWGDARARAAAIWTAERDDIIELLANCSSLKKTGHKPDNIRGPYAQAMDAMLAPTGKAHALDLEVLLKFTDAGIVKGTKKNCASPQHELFPICGEMLDAVQDFAARELALLLDLTVYARAQMVDRKSAARVQSFDDVLYQLRDALRGRGGDTLAAKLRKRYRSVLIDEFQDTDPVQYEVFRRVYQEADRCDELGLFLIGDPKQAIYAFRGADVFTYMGARRDAGDRTNTLGTNWRSDPSLIDGVNALFKGARDPFIFDGIEFSPVKQRPGAADKTGGALANTAPLELLFVPRQGRTGEKGTLIGKAISATELPRGVAGRIATLLNSDATIAGKRVSPGDIAVLCRTNRQAIYMQKALNVLAVPCALEGDASVFESEQAEALERVLLAIIEPGNGRAIRAALATVMMGVTGDQLVALQADEDAWECWQLMYQGWQRAWKNEGFIQAFRGMLAEHDVVKRLLQFADGERRLTNLYHLGELLQSEVMASRAGPRALLRWFRRMRTDKAARADAVGESAQMRLESDAEAVKLVTIHKSKGLEYPIVYCPFLWDGKLLRGTDSAWVRFHDDDDDDRLKLDLCSEDHKAHLALARREALAESLRLCYVALTRAKHMCTVVWGQFRDASTSPLAYLLHQPKIFTTDPAGLDKLAKHVKGLTDAEMTAELDELVHAADGSIVLTKFSAQDVAPYAPRSRLAGTLSCRKTTIALQRIGRLSSFSSLVASDTDGMHVREQERDHDSDLDTASAAPRPGPEVAALTKVPLHDFPGGTRAGQMFHHIFETIDFCDPAPDTLRGRIEAALARFGYDTRRATPLCPAVEGMLRTPLTGRDATMTLADVPRSQRLDELEFMFPVALDGAAMTVAGLADAFRGRADAPWTPSYPERLARLDFAPLTGHLRGFADLIFRHGNRWYLVDYKSNFLGCNSVDYLHARVVAQMEHHHYFLQYHVYLVALHRYLRLRIANYDYEREFGGVFYLFLRGLDADGGGVFYDRPPLAFVNRLSSLVGEPTHPGVRA